MKISKFILFSMLFINAGCSALIPWEKSSRADSTLTWTAKNQRAIWWTKNWSCYSASGRCHDTKYTDHNGKKLNLDDDSLTKYVLNHLYEEMMYWGFVSTLGFRATKETLPTSLEIWQKTMNFNSRYWGALPYHFYTVSLNPHIVLMVQNRYNESRQEIDVLEHEGSLFSNRNDFYQFFLEQTPAYERTYETSRNKDNSRFPPLYGGSTTDFQVEYRVNYLVTRDNKQFGEIKIVTDFPKIWLIDMRYPDLPPQVLENLETNKVRYAIGNDEVLEFFCQDGSCKTMRIDSF